MARGCSDITLDGTQLPQKGGTAAPTFRPMSVAKRLDGSRCQMRQMGTQLSTERGTTPPTFRSMSIVVKRSPISANAVLLYECHTRCNI